MKNGIALFILIGLLVVKSTGKSTNVIPQKNF